MSLFLVVLVNENGLVAIVEFFIKVKFFFSELPNEVEQASVILHLTGKLPLGAIELSLGIFD